MNSKTVALAVVVYGMAWAGGAEPTYVVPIQNQVLTPFARFPITEAQMRIRKGFAKMEYDLPQPLSGAVPLKIEAQGEVSDESKPFHLVGEFAQMDCEVQGEYANCHVKYDRERLPILSDEGKIAVLEYLTATIADASELEIRTQVFQAFSHEAAGDFRQVSVRRR